MYCLLQLYIVISSDIAPYRPLLQLFSVKAVVFLTFWQSSFLSVLEDFGVLKDVSDFKPVSDFLVKCILIALLQPFDYVQQKYM